MYLSFLQLCALMATAAAFPSPENGQPALDKRQATAGGVTEGCKNSYSDNGKPCKIIVRNFSLASLPRLPRIKFFNSLLTVIEHLSQRWLRVNAKRHHTMPLRLVSEFFLRYNLSMSGEELQWLLLTVNIGDLCAQCVKKFCTTRTSRWRNDKYALCLDSPSRCF